MDTKQGFQFASATCGFKKSKKPDLALIYSSVACTYVGVFTTNQVRAVCVDENKNLLKKRKKIRAIVINSGNANACTGKKGVRAAKQTQQIAARLLKIKPDEVLIASTGVIGVPLEMEKMEQGLHYVVPRLDSQKIKSAATAILTSDRFPKIVSRKTKEFFLTGFAKGAGMIHPNIATMLCFFVTDLQMPQQLLQTALKSVVNESFNNISVDGDMSTNDMVILLSNNQSKSAVKSVKDPLYARFRNSLKDACLELAKQIVIDGEGDNKLINVHVDGGRSAVEANEIARSIASSTLFKCAIFGSDPNWGRAASRICATSVKVNQDKIDIFLNKTLVFKSGNPIEFNRQKLNIQIKRSKEVNLSVNLKQGNKSGFAFGCDLSVDYVKFNSGYFT